jgi:hypothetical protein
MAKLFWTQKQDMGPMPREQHAMAYDSVRMRTVMFGGFSDSGDPLGDTWEWNGEFWTQVADIGPAARGSHAMAYDAARGQTIQFGGEVLQLGQATAGGDTWAWDGQAWTQVADTGPAARSGCSMAYDSGRQRVVLFGGRGNTDTWEWDGSDWTQIANDGPSSRTAASMAYDNIRSRIVLFGGAPNTITLFNDTWEFDGNAWTRVADTGPQPRDKAAMAFAGTRTILFGGECLVAAKAPNTLGTLKDTWEWSGKFWTQRQNIGPRDRRAHQMVYDSARDRVVMFGGLSLIPGPEQLSVNLNDTWELPGNSITLTGLTVPTPLNAEGEATVSLSGPSPIGGITVSLSAKGPVDVPPAVTVTEGQASAVFPIIPKSSDPTQFVPGVLTATLGKSTATAEFLIGAP